MAATHAAVVGAGAWGTAVAAHLARRPDLRITLWARDAARAREMAAARSNPRYLPGVPLPAALTVTSALADTVDAALLIVGTPMAALPEMIDALAAVGATAPLVWLAKGLLRVPADAAAPAGVALAHQAIAVLGDVDRLWLCPGVGVVQLATLALTASGRGSPLISTMPKRMRSRWRSRSGA